MRVVSMCFDDGLEETTKSAMELSDIPLTFFIVTGWLDEFRLPIRDPANLGYSHGNLEFWTKVARHHVVGGHGHTHIRLDMVNALQELTSCLQVMKEVAGPPYIVAYPYLKIAFETYGVFDWHRPFAFMPNFEKYGREEVLTQVLGALKAEGKTVWLPIALHGLDGEGWWSVMSKDYVWLISHLKEDGVEFRNITGMMGGSKNDKHVVEFRKEVKLGVEHTTKDSS